MISKDRIKEILVEGRQVDSQRYFEHCLLNHVKTFYFLCERLCQSADNVVLSSPELKHYILAQLRDRKIDVTDQFNPEGWFGSAWTNWADPSKNETHFRSEYRDALIRTGREPYSYQIRPECFGDVVEIFAEFQKDVSLRSVTAPGNGPKDESVAAANAGTISARTLVYRFLELQRLSPQSRDWTEERLAGNPPRLFRLRQLAALFRGFGIPWDPQSFVQGRFIQPAHTRYDSLFSNLAREMPERRSSRIDHARHQLPEFFAILFDYRKRVDDLLSFSSGVMEASGLYLAAHRRAGEINRIIERAVGPLDDTLSALISPEGAVFSVEELTRDYGYPAVDLSDIDEDWW